MKQQPTQQQQQQQQQQIWKLSVIFLQYFLQKNYNVTPKHPNLQHYYAF